MNRSGIAGVGVLALIAMSGCRRDRALAYERVELPGFSIELPKSPNMGPIVTASDRERYPAGQIKRGQVREPVHVAALSWQPGVLSTQEELTDMIKIMATAMASKPVTPRITSPARADTVAGKPAMRIGVTIEPLELELVEVTCGGRAIQIMVGARAPGPIIERMLRTFDCHPDPAREPELATDRAPVAFDELTGWSAMANPEAFTIINGTTVAVFSVTSDAHQVEKLGFVKVVGAMIETMFGAWTLDTSERPTRHGRTRDLVFGDAVDDGEAIRIAAGLWPCPVGPAVIGLVMQASDGDRAQFRETAIDVLMRARCLNPGETPPALAPAPTE